MADLLESKKHTCLLNGRFPRQITCNAFKKYPITPVAVEQRTGASSLFVETGSEMGAARQFKALPGQVTQAETGARAVTPTCIPYLQETARTDTAAGRGLW